MNRARLQSLQISSGLLTIIIVAAVGAIAYFLTWPKYKNFRDTLNSRNEKQDALQNRRSQMQDLQELAAEVKRKDKDLTKLDEALPDAPRIPELLANLDYLTKQSGVVLEGLQLTTPDAATAPKEPPSGGPKEGGEEVKPAGPKTAKIEIDMEITGNYATLKTFILNVEQNLRLLDIDALLFGPVEKPVFGEGAESASPGSQGFTVKLSTYYQTKGK